METTNFDLLRSRVPEMPIVVLAEQPDLGSDVLTFQDYLIGGERIIPLFSSEETFRASVGTGNLGRPTYTIDRNVLAQAAPPEAVFLLDPQLPSQLRFTGAEFRTALKPSPSDP